MALGASLAAAVQPLDVQGSFFVNPATGNRFQIVGVAYQPGGSAGYNPDLKKDPLSNKDICLRDAALMQILGINTIRVYNLNPNLNHDECASIFNAAGIYMLIDVNSPLVGESITTEKPWESYYASYINRTCAVVEAFKDYPNTLAFFAGNEVIADVASAQFVPPYMRAITRDLKNYIAKHSSRRIPVGYSAADVRSVLFDTWQYLQCSLNGTTDDMTRGDLFALNSYSWCGSSSFETSGYNTLVAGFTGSSVPIFYSEYGCNEPSPRIFTEVAAIYGPQMTGVFSGGVVYEYSQEPNNYGLVEINSDGSVTLLRDFRTLQSQLAKLDFTKIQGAKPTGNSPQPPKCDPKLITSQGFNNNFTVPVLPPGAPEILDKGVSPKPKGKIVSISDYTVRYRVKDVDGKFLSGLVVKPLADDAINAPGTNTPTTTDTPPELPPPGSSSGSGSDEKDAAAGLRVEVLAVAAVAGVAAMITSLW